MLLLPMAELACLAQNNSGRVPALNVMNAVVLSSTSGKRKRSQKLPVIPRATDSMNAFVPVSSFLGNRSTQCFIDGNASGVTRLKVARTRLLADKPVRFTPCAKWVEQSATVTVETDCEEAYDVYADIQEMPNWSPWLREVRVDPRDGMLSTWVLFSRGIEISWKARITANQRGALIAWNSESGLTNRGNVKFVDVSDDDSRTAKTNVTLSIEFSVPDFLADAFDGSFIKRFVGETMLSDLKRYRRHCLLQKYQAKK